MAATRERYGIDAPGVVRTLFGVGVALVFGGAIAFWLMRAGHNSRIIHFLRDNGFVVGGCLIIAGGWMLVSSLWLKRRVLHRLLDEHRWSGVERVLDVGCGRGLVAVGAAKRVPKGGSVIGIDLWQEKDLSGNNLDAALQNAAVAGVAGRVAFETGDARVLPYDDATFDVVASMTAIHNIPDRVGRRKAIDEVWRVTKPAGRILIFDIRHARSYGAQLRELGATVTVAGPFFLWGMLGWRLAATKD